MKSEVTTRIRIAEPQIGPEERRAVLEVLESGHLAEGQRVREFEEAIRSRVGSRHAVAVANGTAALHLALLAAGVRPGDRVGVPGFTFIATANAVLMAGARPVLLDVDAASFNLDLGALRRQARGLAAVVPVNLYGQAADVDAIGEIASDAGARLMVDSAQALGGRYKDRMIGSTAPLETFSFYATKNVTTGEGGLVAAESDEAAELMRSWRNHGRAAGPGGGYDHVRLGWNYRMTDLVAAIGIEQLRKLERITTARRRNAKRLSAGLAGIAGVELPSEAPYAYHAYHQFTIRVTKGPAARTALRESLASKGIDTGVYYPKALNAYPHLRDSAPSPLRVSEQLAGEVLSLPVHPGVSEGDIDRVVEAVRAWAPP